MAEIISMVGIISVAVQGLGSVLIFFLRLFIKKRKQH